MDTTERHDGIPQGLLDDDLDVTAQKPIAVRPGLAAKYVETARFVASLPEPEALAAFLPAEDDSRLDELRRFLIFVTKGWPTGIPYYFFPKMRDEIRLLHRHEHMDGSFPESLFGRPTSVRNPKGEIIPAMFFCPYTSCGRGKRGDFPSLRHQMGKLLLLNALGWDVYGCPNPILYRCRIQRAIPAVHNLVAESDDASLEEQEKAVRKMHGIVGAVVFSGNRSYHQYFRLRSPIVNPHVVTPDELDGMKHSVTLTGGRTVTGWHVVQSMKRANKLPPIPVEPFRYAADLLRGLILERGGIRLCPSTLFNFSCLSRVPGFVHTGSGGLARLISVDADAAVYGNSLCEPDDVRYSPFWRKELGIPDEEVFPPKHGDRSDRSAATPSSLEDIGHYDPTIEDEEGPETGNRTDPHAQPPTENSQGGETSIPVNTIGTTKCRSVPSRTFLDDLSDFEELQTIGIQSRGTRRSIHKLMIKVALIRGWVRHDPNGKKITLDANRIADEWRTVLLLSGGSIGCTVEEGCADIIREIGARNRGSLNGHVRFGALDCTKLPDLDPERRKNLRERVRRLMSDEARHSGLPPADRRMRSTATGIANVVADVLYPKIRSLPVQCMTGMLAVPAREMRNKCPGANYAPIREWLHRLNLMRQTRGASQIAGLTRLYWINAPLIVWLLGFGNDELTWERHVGKREGVDDLPPVSS